MVRIAPITCNGIGTAGGITAITLPGTAGVADKDLLVYFYGSSDLQIQSSADASAWSDSLPLTPGAWYPVEGGGSLRVKNTNAGTRVLRGLIRYPGEPS